MYIASKEARETLYWLRLLDKSNWIALDYNVYIIACEELINILTAIIKTSEKGRYQ